MPIKYISSNMSFKSVHVDQVHDKIPAGQYYVRIDRMGDLQLEKTERKEEHVVYRKTCHASKFVLGLFIKPVDLLEIILSGQQQR